MEAACKQNKIRQVWLDADANGYALFMNICDSSRLLEAISDQNVN